MSYYLPDLPATHPLTPLCIHTLIPRARHLSLPHPPPLCSRQAFRQPARHVYHHPTVRLYWNIVLSPQPSSVRFHSYTHSICSRGQYQKPFTVGLRCDIPSLMQYPCNPVHTHLRSPTPSTSLMPCISREECRNQLAFHVLWSVWVNTFCCSYPDMPCYYLARRCRRRVSVNCIRCPG